MTLTEHALLAHVEQGQFLAIGEHLFQLGWANFMGHALCLRIFCTYFQLSMAIDRVRYGACVIGAKPFDYRATQNQKLGDRNLSCRSCE